MSREILINPPAYIDRVQRMKYGAVQALTGMAEIAWADLVQLTTQIAETNDDATRDLSINHRALMLAWSIVDQADLLRHLIASEKGNLDLPEVAKFLAAAEPVKDVRNWMRHIPQRVKAYQSKKEPMPPVLGALSFATVVRASANLSHGALINRSDVIEFHTIVLLNTSFERAARLEGEPVLYDAFKVPVDHFVLQAFGILLPIGEIVALMGGLCDALAAALDTWVETKIAEAHTKGLDVAQFSQPAYPPGMNYRAVAKSNKSEP